MGGYYEKAGGLSADGLKKLRRRAGKSRGKGCGLRSISFGRITPFY